MRTKEYIYVRNIYLEYGNYIWCFEVIRCVMNLSVTKVYVNIQWANLPIKIANIVLSDAEFR
jgi:hypothetical protein